ncbi:hypothetical protein AFL01nite_21440 [Aeromicrobium flavum]|uniref:Uncharacterized protein n=1 Tax=Aeromicrobium flavum TaxID=416568 RepID=A0A512HWJ0_9ACTN|nr:glycosyltransferase [Aeromicrobium flavum]GEO89817.1 hypothetical protein AFL01nite_21440 [Aeromicrobium flavum]
MSGQPRAGSGDAGRLRVALGAAACGPGDEPEQSAGWAFALAAAQEHDVWVFTRPRLAESMESALRADTELAQHVTLIYHDLPAWVQRIRTLPLGIYVYYGFWQWTLRRVVRRTHDEVGFDVLHHVTFANDWLPTALTAVPDVPLVWGPVGGATAVPVRRLRRWLGARGAVVETVRGALTGLPRRLWGDRIAARASLVVAQNPGVAERFGDSRRVEVEPNAALEPLAVVDRPHVRRSDDGHLAVFVGRLLAWKGGRLALATLAHPRAAGWRLEVFGEGYERPALEALARELGIDDRVTFHGHRPRTEVLDAFVRADALLFPSMHDQAGWVAGEASSLGCPVVCLPLGGPATLAERNAYVAPLEGDIVANLAEQLGAAAEHGGTPHDRWSRERLPAVVGRWYREVAR